MNDSFRNTLLAVLALAAGAVAQPEPATVERVFADFETAVWQPGSYNMATGESRLAAEAPAGLAETSKRSLEVTAHFSGKGFEAFSVVPPNGAIPGQCRRVSVWVKTDQEGYSWQLAFRGPNNEDRVGNKKLEVSLAAKPGAWQHIESPLPANWPQPLTLAALSVHNWSRKTDKADARLLVDDLRVTTDLSGVDPAKTPLVEVQLQSPQERNLFLEGEPVSFLLQCDSWLGRSLTGEVNWTARSLGGEPWAEQSRSFSFTDLHTEGIALKPPAFGVHELSVAAKLSSGEEVHRSLRFALAPKPNALTDEEKRQSPWGINIHGGVPGVAYKALARAGFTWVRDYAYSFEWMRNARGEDGKYSGWPWYHRLDASLKDSGLMLLPCLVKAIDRDAAAQKRIQPTPQWKRDLMHILISFPQYTAWELDNEYEYHHWREEQAIDWATYRGYHQAFGEAVNYLDSNLLAVEQGTAGVFPERVEALVKSGAFDQIDVVNGHHYCRLDPPEAHVFDHADRGADAPPRTFFDALREFARAADADGRDRQAWLTEFGWDTLAGSIVPENLQAAYLQRGYLLGLQAGLDRMFWYWNRDTKEKPDNFFDGCGIWNPADEPKPAAAAAAAMFHFLKLPQPVGMFSVGRNTLGHVFRDRGRLVACVFKVKPDKTSITAEFGSGDCFDCYGNPLAGRKHQLKPEPLWIVGLEEDDPLVRQTAYGLESREFVRTTGGDSVQVVGRVHNGGEQPLRATAVLTAPEGWTVDRTQVAVQAAAGQTLTVPFRVTVPDTQAHGVQQVQLTFGEAAGQRVLTVAVQVEEPVQLSPLPLTGAPGVTAAVARLRNRSNRAKRVRLRARLPEGWRAIPAEQQVTLAPAAVTEAPLQIQWTPAWKPTERAEIEVVNEAGQVLTRAGLIPSTWTLPAVTGIREDGDLADWPAQAELPDWALGCDTGKADARVFAGHSPAGLHFAFEVNNSKVEVTDPKSFWNQDAIEVFVDTKGDGAERSKYAPTDHQFWFCPLVGEKRVYVGRWKRNDELESTRYDLPGVKSFAGATATGYRLEVLIPADMLTGYAPRSDGLLGLSFVATVHGRDGKRQVYWPQPKDPNLLGKPNTWGRAVLK